MSNKPLQVFLDANVVIQAGKPPGGPLFTRVVDLVKGGFISVLTTDLTKMEVSKKHAKNDFSVVKEVGRPHFRRIVKDLTAVELPDMTKDEIYNQLLEKYSGEIEKMFMSLGAKAFSIDSVKPSKVFGAYANETGFFSGEGKKDQFPDAFIFECLKAEASEQKPVLIVSDDDDFTEPVKSEEHLSILKSIPDLFTQLGLQIDAPDLDDFLQGHHDEALELVDAELKDWGLQVSDVEDAEIEDTTVTEIEFLDLTSFGNAQKGGDILVVGRVRITADVSYTHPDWDTATYDSEDQVLHAFRDVSGETEIETDADFSMSILADSDGNPREIGELRFMNDDFVWVEINPYKTYK